MDILMVIKSTVQVRKLILTLLIILIILQSWCAGARVICWVCSKTHWLRFISSTLRMNANFLVLPESSWTQPAIRMSNSDMKSEKKTVHDNILFEPHLVVDRNKALSETNRSELFGQSLRENRTEPNRASTSLVM